MLKCCTGSHEPGRVANELELVVVGEPAGLVTILNECCNQNRQPLLIVVVELYIAHNASEAIISPVLDSWQRFQPILLWRGKVDRKGVGKSVLSKIRVPSFYCTLCELMRTDGVSNAT